LVAAYPIQKSGFIVTRIVVDTVMQQKLHNLTEPLELCNESGKVLARVTPVLDVSQYEPLEPQVSEEELLRRSQSEGKTYTTDDVLAYLERVEYGTNSCPT
jgi:hypothetical protein